MARKIKILTCLIDFSETKYWSISLESRLKIDLEAVFHIIHIFNKSLPYKYIPISLLFLTKQRNSKPGLRSCHLLRTRLYPTSGWSPFSSKSSQWTNLQKYRNLLKPLQFYVTYNYRPFQDNCNTAIGGKN